MFPTLLEIGPLKLHMYGLMIAFGFLIALHFLRRDGEERLGVSGDEMTTMALWAFFWGLLGTRVMHMIMFPEDYAINDPVGWIALWQGGLVFQGAIPAAMLYAFFALRKRKISFLRMADVVMPWIPLAQAFGRGGCFFNGCCFGLVTHEAPWAMKFPPGSPPQRSYPGPDGWSLPVHPTQLYEMLGLLLMFVALLWLRKRNFAPGAMLALYMIFAGALRFVVEMFRGDGNPTTLGMGVLTNQQVFSLVLLAGGVVLWLYLQARQRGATAAPAR